VAVKAAKKRPIGRRGNGARHNTPDLILMGHEACGGYKGRLNALGLVLLPLGLTAKCGSQQIKNNTLKNEEVPFFL